MTHSGSTTTWADPGIYKLPCGCVQYVVEIDPVGMRLAIVESEDYECLRSHKPSDFDAATFLPAGQAMAMYEGQRS